MLKSPVVIKALCLFISLAFISCSGTNQTTPAQSPDTIVVGEVDDIRVTYGELVENFSSGNPNGEHTLAELKEFLPIYLDYRAKIVAAEDAGYFDNETVLNEYELYSKQAAYSYWLENEIRPTLFEEYKSKYGVELKSSHLLIGLPQTATPDDTLEAYNTLIRARNEYLEGVSMSDLNEKYSTKQQGRSMGGDLPWFVQGSTVPEFENVLFSLDTGEISMPFRTQFGYHVILLEDKRERKADRKVSHIYTRPNSQGQIDSAYSALKSGQAWNKTVEEYTMDSPTAQNGGVIGWVSYGSRYRGDFIDSVMQVDPDRPFSEPIRTSYGYHILKIDSIRTFESQADRDEFLMNELESSDNFRKSNGFVVGWLKEQYSHTDHTVTRETLTADLRSADTLKVNSYEAPEGYTDTVIFEFDGREYTVSDFLQYLKDTRGDRAVGTVTDSWFFDFERAVIDTGLTELTLKYFPEFSGQTDNYLSGLVVYQINEDSVWSASTVDTTALRKIYRENPGDYSYNTRYWYHLISSVRDSSLQNAIDFIEQGGSPDSIRTHGIAVAVSSDSTGAYQGEPFDKLSDMEAGTFSEWFEYNDRQSVFYLNDILPPRRMTFEEAFNRLLTVYQPVREQNWLERMRDMYEVKTFPESLEEAYSMEHSME